MNVTLTPDLKRRIARLVAERGFDSPEAALSEAVSLLEGDEEALCDGEIAEVAESLREADKEGWLTVDEVREHLDRVARDIEAKLPR